MSKKEEKNLVLKETTEDFKQLEIGDKVYLPSSVRIDYWTFLGFNPVHPKYVMFESSYDVTDIKGVYLDAKHGVGKTYYTSYKRACDMLHEKALKNVETVKRIYLKD